MMSSTSEPTSPSSHLNSASESYDVIYEQMKAGLVKRFPPALIRLKPEFEHSAPNRIRIYLDRDRIKGTHYQITFRREYYEFALHFESSREMSLKRRQAFDPHLDELTKQVGILVRSGPVENRGWMRVWYEQNREPIGQDQIKLYIDQYSRFIAATFPILAKLYGL